MHVYDNDSMFLKVNSLHCGLQCPHVLAVQRRRPVAVLRGCAANYSGDGLWLYCVAAPRSTAAVKPMCIFALSVIIQKLTN
jgi:hypothetical protein